MGHAFPNEASEFVYVRSYSRWLEEEQRRETWSETVDRYIAFIEKHVGGVVPRKVFKKAHEKILNMDVMPSMRALWSAGKAAESTNVAMYNCAFQAIDCIEAFAECLYILMCGTGYGFSVENKFISKLPSVAKLNGKGAGTYEILDSKEGWADSVKHLMTSLYSGFDMEMDYSLLRPRGARLKTFGGRSSGPAPLVNLHQFIRQTFVNAQDRKLTSLECHDILNTIADIVVVGGVRRSSQISLSDLDDEIMAKAKTPPFPPYRGMANNSAVYDDKPGAIRFLQEWASLAASGSGERGIYNREGAIKLCPDRRDATKIVGVNPCGEISLRSRQFCNLTEVVVRPGDDLDDLLDKVETATWLGAIQSTFTYFPYLSRIWKNNCEQERLLGVSITGQKDYVDAMTEEAFKAMMSKSLKIARRAASALDINMPTAVTCVKPSGTVSQLVNSSSGTRGRRSRYMVRRYRISANDPLFRMMRDQGFKFSPENHQGPKDWEKTKNGDLNACSIYEKGKRWSEDKVQTWVCEFPVESPKTSVMEDEESAIDQLKYYKKVRKHWCEHNASCTIKVREDEWFEVGNWVYQNWKYVTGVTFLPMDGGKYKQVPEEAIDEQTYKKMKEELPKIDYNKLSEYEKEDNTQGSKELACVGDKCEI